MSTSKIVGFYHRGDLDGIASAAILKKEFNHAAYELTLIGIEFGDKLDIDKLIEGADTVLMVDFVLEPFERMIDLNKKCNLIWIDHHASSLKYVAKNQGIKFKGVLGDERNLKSAAYLLWEYFYPQTEVPYGIKLLSLFDTWQHNFDEDILNFYYGVEVTSGMKPDVGIWEDIFRSYDKSQIIIKSMIHSGALIRNHIKMKDALYAVDHAFETEFEGLKAIAINVGFPGSMKFDSVWDENKYDLMIGFSRRKAGFWKFSLYATQTDRVNCSAIAGKYGGGGHKGAAGFELDYIPFEI